MCRWKLTIVSSGWRVQRVGHGWRATENEEVMTLNELVSIRHQSFPGGNTETGHEKEKGERKKKLTCKCIGCGIPPKFSITQNDH